jgi:PAS domain S-box-containing protein
LNLRGRPSRLPDGSTLWDVVALDITERKRVEDALREREAQLRRSEERYRLLFERSFVGIFRTREDGVVMDCNDAFARILGHAGAADMRGRNVSEHYVTPAERGVVVARLAAGEEVVDVELAARRVDGSIVPVLVSARRLVEPDGPIHEGIVIDLTDRKRAEEAVALRSVAELANAAAHEINNPLTVVLGYLTLGEQARNAAHAVERARAAALRIRDIVLHMTRITRLERSKGWSSTLPQMLDLRRSADEDLPGPPSG